MDGNKGGRLGWISRVSPHGGLQGVLAHQPALQAKFDAFMQTLEGDDVVPARVMALCRAQIEFVHGGPEPAPQALSSAEQAAVEVAALMPYSHHAIEDEHIAALRTHFGEKGGVDILTATAFFDVQARLSRVFEV